MVLTTHVGCSTNYGTNDSRVLLADPVRDDVVLDDPVLLPVIDGLLVTDEVVVNDDVDVRLGVLLAVRDAVEVTLGVGGNSTTFCV